MVWAFEPKNITSSFLELPEIEPSRAELLKACGSRAKFRAQPRLDTPLTTSHYLAVDTSTKLQFFSNSTKLKTNLRLDKGKLAKSDTAGWLAVNGVTRQ